MPLAQSIPETPACGQKTPARRPQHRSPHPEGSASLGTARSARVQHGSSRTRRHVTVTIRGGFYAHKPGNRKADLQGPAEVRAENGTSHLASSHWNELLQVAKPAAQTVRLGSPPPAGRGNAMSTEGHGVQLALNVNQILPPDGAQTLGRGRDGGMTPQQVRISADQGGLTLVPRASRALPRQAGGTLLTHCSTRGPRPKPALPEGSLQSGQVWESPRSAQRAPKPERQQRQSARSQTNSKITNDDVLGPLEHSPERWGFWTS